MKAHAEMKNTNRMAIKLKDGAKIAIERKTIDDSEQYLIKLSDNVLINGMIVPEGVLLFLKKLIFHDKNIILEGIVLVNVGLRTVWVNQQGLLHEFIGSYPIEPEEDLHSGELRLNLSNVEEISTDLKMFNDMMKKGLIEGTPYELGEYGLYYPQMELIEAERDENADYLNERIKYNSFLRVIDGNKVKKIGKKSDKN